MICDMNKQIEMSYYGLYLRAYFEDHPEDEYLNNDDFIEARSDQASEEFERLRLEGASVSQAHEGAMSVLLSGIGDE